MARPGLTTHRKFRRLARALKSQILARGALELLWETCYESGDDYVGTAMDIEHLVGWAGEPGVLTSALADAGAPEGVGFIEPVGSGQADCTRFRVHDLWHHAPDYVAKRRQRELERQRKMAPAQPVSRTAPDGNHQQPSSDWQLGVDRTPPPSHSPAPSPGKEISPEPDGSAPAAPSPTVLEFPTVGTAGRVWPFTEAHVAEWAGLFPTIDVLQEARNALAWVQANPGRRKTGSGMGRFLVRWFTTATNDGRGKQASAPPGNEAKRKLGPPGGWECLHVETCNSPGQCQINTRLNRPERKAAS